MRERALVRDWSKDLPLMTRIARIYADLAEARVRLTSLEKALAAQRVVVGLASNGSA